MITGATPAACYAHVNDRASREKIFAQALSPRFGDGVDAIISAGRKVLAAAMEKAGTIIAESPRAPSTSFLKKPKRILADG